MSAPSSASAPPTRAGETPALFLQPCQNPSGKQLVHLAQGFDEAVHFVLRVVEVEAGPERRGNAEFAVKRLIAMMPGAHRYAALIQHCGDIKSVGIREDQADETGATALWSED